MGTRSASGQKVDLSIEGQLVNTLEDGGLASSNFAMTALAWSLDNGVSANEANRAWEKIDIELSGGGVVDIDIRNATGLDIGAGNGVDALGQTVLFEEIVALVVHHVSGDGSLQIQATAPSSPVSWIPTGACAVATGGALKAGGVRVWAENDTDGLDTTPLASEIRFDASGGAVQFSVYIIGRHDDDESSSSSSSSGSSSSSSSSTNSSSSSSASSSSSSSQTP